MALELERAIRGQDLHQKRRAVDLAWEERGPEAVDHARAVLLQHMLVHRCRGKHLGAGEALLQLRRREEVVAMAVRDVDGLEFLVGNRQLDPVRKGGALGVGGRRVDEDGLVLAVDQREGRGEKARSVDCW